MFILALADICGDRCVADLQEDANLRIRQATALTPCLLKQSYDGLLLQFAEPFSLGTLTILELPIEKGGAKDAEEEQIRGSEKEDRNLPRGS